MGKKRNVLQTLLYILKHKLKSLILYRRFFRLERKRVILHLFTNLKKLPVQKQRCYAYVCVLCIYKHGILKSLGLGFSIIQSNFKTILHSKNLRSSGAAKYEIRFWLQCYACTVR